MPSEQSVPASGFETVPVMSGCPASLRTTASLEVAAGPLRTNDFVPSLVPDEGVTVVGLAATAGATAVRDSPRTVLARTAERPSAGRIHPLSPHSAPLLSVC